MERKHIQEGKDEAAFHIQEGKGQSSEPHPGG